MDTCCLAARNQRGRHDLVQVTFCHQGTIGVHRMDEEMHSDKNILHVCQQFRLVAGGVHYDIVDTSLSWFESRVTSNIIVTEVSTVFGSLFLQVDEGQICNCRLGCWTHPRFTSEPCGVSIIIWYVGFEQHVFEGCEVHTLITASYIVWHQQRHLTCRTGWQRLCYV